MNIRANDHTSGKSMTPHPVPQTQPSLGHLTAEAEKLFADLEALSRDKAGVSRPSYGDAESKAFDMIEEFAKGEGLLTSRDEAANLVIELVQIDADQEYILIGSHLDSVPQGGNYDGAAGVIAGLLCLIELKRSGITPEIPVKVIALRGEESAWFGACYLGSKALLGKLDESEQKLTQRDDGRTLKEHMADCGAQVERIGANEVLIDTSKIKAFFELHIEQGPVMIARNLPVAAVTGIRGNIRHREIHCVGEAGHSGAVPRWLRHDAVFATAELITRIDDHWTTILQHGGDLVATTGILSTNPQNHAMSRIPGEVTFSFEARSQYEHTLAAIEALLHSECATITYERRVDFEFDKPVKTPPAVLDQDIVERINNACLEEGLPVEAIPSGAGHDASLFANAGVSTGMIFVRNRNGSHNPEEEMDIEDFMRGISVLYRTITEFKK
ncbi:Zn-dependent hydrolase [Maridesulfovibrio hydrothermalis]|uniref:Amidase, hydantoinase/carbamoylase family n=1 Tax=Maridesulfovibrio hydrothermalis AM13 = DSM 14728 TaxID=1121451 RepID=L0RC73_9BACT|nr:Zn-dependent hydrolase [Maridesulfovibrio hydrothermalis]CCO24349.1 Amidase, hydantoinase/carbamoylase family [Maridesulfovibrio hydrothermalis AM13 = DSM 14728]